MPSTRWSTRARARTKQSSDGSFTTRYVIRLSRHLPTILVTLVVLQEGKKMVLNINDSQILWPGKLKRKPEGIIIPTHLKVLTIEEKPFIYVRRLGIDEPDCDIKDEVPCPMFNATDGTGKWTQINGFLLSVKP